MSDNEHTLNVNLQNSNDAPTSRGGSSSGVTSKDQNFAPLTGGGGQLANRKGTGLGGDPYRPKSIPAAPEILNILSILSDSSQTIRKVFLPFRKIYQLFANNAAEEKNILKKESANQKEKGKYSDVTSPGISTVIEDLLGPTETGEPLRTRDPESPEDFLAAGYQFYKGGQTLPFKDGKAQGRAAAGGEYYNPALKQVYGRETEGSESSAPGVFKTIQDWLKSQADIGDPMAKMVVKSGKVLQSAFQKFSEGPVAKSIIDVFKTVKAPFTYGFNMIWKPISKTSKGLWGKFNKTVIDNIMPLTKLGGIAGGLWSAFKIGKAVLTNWASEWEQFSPQVMSTKAIQAVANMERQMKAARMTGGEMATSAEITGEQTQIWTDIKAVLVDSIMPLINGIHKMITPLLQLLRGVVNIVGIGVKILTEGIGFVLNSLGGMLDFAFGWLADLLGGLYETVSDMFDFAKKKDNDSGMELMDPVFDMFGVTSGGFSTMSKSVMASRQRQNGLPGNID
jgi:hypothetical protein